MSRLLTAAFASITALAALPAAAIESHCDMTLPRFTSDQATDETSNPLMTRIPRNIVVEHAGFATPDAAAKCFGARYHDTRAAKHITYIVPVDGGWGYLTPAKGPRDAGRAYVEALYRAAQSTGHELHALAHTQPSGGFNFTSTDVVKMLGSSATLYITDKRNGTYRADGPTIRAYMQEHGLGHTTIATARFLEHTKVRGFAGTLVK